MHGNVSSGFLVKGDAKSPREIPRKPRYKISNVSTICRLGSRDNGTESSRSGGIGGKKAASIAAAWKKIDTRTSVGREERTGRWRWSRARLPFLSLPREEKWYFAQPIVPCALLSLTACGPFNVRDPRRLPTLLTRMSWRDFSTGRNKKQWYKDEWISRILKWSMRYDWLLLGWFGRVGERRK